MNRIALFAFLAATTRVIFSAPTPPQILVVAPSGGPQCVRFNSPVCNALGGQGYNYASFPNPLAPAYLPNAQKAESEANAVIQQALASQCSKYVVEFMCFSYFPLCDPSSTTTPPVLPCTSLCEQVRSDCEPILNATYGTRWPQWANCENIANVIAQNRAEDLCFSGKASETTTPTQATTQPTASSTPLHLTSPQHPLCGACNPVHVTSKALEEALRNYTFVAKVKVQSKTTAGKALAYAVEVLEYSQLQQCTTAPQLPPKKAVISMANEQCPPCVDLTPGQVYLVGGYTNGQDKSGIWSVPSQANIVSTWSSEFSQKWVQITAKNNKCRANLAHI